MLRIVQLPWRRRRLRARRRPRVHDLCALSTYLLTISVWPHKGVISL